VHSRVAAVSLVSMHHRGEVKSLVGPPFQRASVWIEQEIAIAAYRVQILKDVIPVQLYIQAGIPLEGLRDKILLNAEPLSRTMRCSNTSVRLSKSALGRSDAQLPRNFSRRLR
jgi:hypothetical protein